MATGLDPNRIHSLVIFNEIQLEYSLSGDIECRFYVDPSLDTCLDKIGLYRIGWTHKQDFVVIKDVHNCSADEFDERRLIFPISELSKELVREGVEYQFCYFHPFGDRKKYQLCGRSETFRFVKPMTNSTEKGRRNASPSAPEMSIHYPILDLEALEINRTVPKRVYDLNDRSFDELFRSEDNYFASTPKDDRKSFVYEIEAKDKELEEMKERFDKQLRIKDLEIEKLKTSVRLAEEKVSSLEYELQTKVENEVRLEAIHNDLMDSIRVSETKNCSLEEKLQIRDKRIKTLEKQVFKGFYFCYVFYESMFKTSIEFC